MANKNYLEADLTVYELASTTFQTGFSVKSNKLE